MVNVSRLEIFHQVCGAGRLVLIHYLCDHHKMEQACRLYVPVLLQVRMADLDEVQGKVGQEMRRGIMVACGEGSRK